MSSDPFIEASLSEFRRYKDYAERAMAQVPDARLHEALSVETNSIAVIVRHMGGNLRSRFTNFLTSDGEKPWRDRDSEFRADFPDRSAMMAHWDQGWNVLFSALESLTPHDLARTVLIRGEPHGVPRAILRSLSHMAYHAGQIVLVSRALVERESGQWITLTIPRGGSGAFNARIGFTARPGDAPTGHQS